MRSRSSHVLYDEPPPESTRTRSADGFATRWGSASRTLFRASRPIVTSPPAVPAVIREDDLEHLIGWERDVRRAPIRTADEPIAGTVRSPIRREAVRIGASTRGPRKEPAAGS